MSPLGLRAKKYKSVYVFHVGKGIKDDNVFVVIKSHGILLLCVLIWSPLGIKKALATPKLVSFRDLI